MARLRRDIIPKNKYRPDPKTIPKVKEKNITFKKTIKRNCCSYKFPKMVHVKVPRIPMTAKIFYRYLLIGLVFYPQ